MRFVLATNIVMRLTGMLRKTCCKRGETLVLVPCKSIHTFGMRTSLDIAFIDADAFVLYAERELAPRQRRSHKRAVAVLERRSDRTGYWPRAGEQLAFSPIAAAEREEESRE